MPFCKLDDVTIYYEVHGEGQPLLLIHGLGSSSKDWEYQLDVFKAHYQVILLDLRGHGQSSRPAKGYSMPQFASDVADLLQSLDITKPHVLGLSLGGMISFELALKDKISPRSLTIVNSLPEVKPNNFRQLLLIYGRLGLMRILGLKRFGPVLAKRLFPSDEHASVREVFLERWQHNDPKSYFKSFDAIIGWSVVARLEEIDAPTLFISAEHDYSPTSLKEDYAAQMPNAKVLEVKDMHHALPAEAPEVFNMMVLSWLKTL